jgi:glycosyltransferase involved in cell wall biosynthesis
MHVIVVSDYGDVRGGASQVAIASARALAEQAVRVTFFCGVPPVSARLRHPGIEVECLGLTDVWEKGPAAAALQGVWNARAARAFRNRLASCDPKTTIIHFHQWTKALSPSLLRVAGRTPFSAVITLHDYLSFCPSGMYFDFSRNAPCSRRPLSLGCVAAPCDVRSYAHKAVRLARQFDLPSLLRRVQDRWTFVHVSSLSARVARRHLPAAARHRVILHPVDMPAAPPATPAARSSLLYVGRFLREKGCIELANAAAALGRDVVFMGSGPMEAEIRALNPRARFLPWGSAHAVADALDRSRALVLPSICFETFGMVVPEALARGVPVVVSDRVGAQELVEDGVNGFVHAAADQTALQDCLSRLASDEVVRAMGERAFNGYWMNPPSPAVHARALLAVFAEALGHS